MQIHFENPINVLEQQARQAGISINLLCTTAKVARTTWTRAKNGTHTLNYSTIEKLSDALNELCGQDSISANKELINLNAI